MLECGYCGQKHGLLTEDHPPFTYVEERKLWMSPPVDGVVYGGSTPHEAYINYLQNQEHSVG